MIRFQQGNTKLGRSVFSWSLPARRQICRGATHVCSQDCYAKRGHFHHTSNQQRYEANFQASRQPDFVAQAQSAIHRQRIRVLRVHVSGDFYSVRYIRCWIAIARACPATKFFAFTRSYRQVALCAALRELARLPNVHLWLSEDRETLTTGRAPVWPGVGRAFMVAQPSDEALVPTDCNLVFRNRPKQPLKRLRGVQVCPVEQGVARQVKMTCGRCRLCFSQRLLRAVPSAPPTLQYIPHDAAPVLTLAVAGL